VKRDRHYTSWAATLATAAELARRCYDTTITFGNTPKVDLLAATKGRPVFEVQVKGISKKENGVWIQKSFFDGQPQRDLFLFIVEVPGQDKKEPFQFFIMTHKESKEAFDSTRKVKRDGSGVSLLTFPRTKVDDTLRLLGNDKKRFSLFPAVPYPPFFLAKKGLQFYRTSVL